MALRDQREKETAPVTPTVSRSCLVVTICAWGKATESAHHQQLTPTSAKIRIPKFPPKPQNPI